MRLEFRVRGRRTIAQQASAKADERGNVRRAGGATTTIVRGVVEPPFNLSPPSPLLHAAVFLPSPLLQRQISAQLLYIHLFHSFACYTLFQTLSLTPARPRPVSFFIRNKFHRHPPQSHRSRKSLWTSSNFIFTGGASSLFNLSPGHAAAFQAS